ncbi:MAG: HPr family phosphocarrier protein [Oscillospiraceae bacterium]|jgi:phosphotransferase system HPr-like phosphotransfer protein|nr:HPr family phosphocarrier protein [Oscillospiraceae bacterium]
MQTLTVRISDVTQVKRFVALAGVCPAEIDLVTGRYQVDAKSIMGIFSLDLSQPLLLKYYENVDDGDEVYENFKKSIEDFIIE